MIFQSFKRTALIGLGLSCIGLGFMPPLRQEAIAQVTTEASASDIMSWFRRRRIRAGSRDPQRQLLAPADVVLDSSQSQALKPDQVWHLKPLFIWKGEAASIELSLQDDVNEVIWEAPLEKGDRWLVYDGDELVPGEKYVWRLRWTDAPPTSMPFEVMSANERQVVQEDLDAIASAASLDNDDQEAEILQGQIQYFQDRELASDFLNVAFQTEELFEQMMRSLYGDTTGETASEKCVKS